MEQTFRKDTPYAPTNEVNGGIVSYNTDWNPDIVKKSRQVAYKKMYDYCKGPYSIVEEGQVLGSAITTPLGDGALTTKETNWKIRFQCDH